MWQILVSIPSRFSPPAGTLPHHGANTVATTRCHVCCRCRRCSCRGTRGIGYLRWPQDFCISRAPASRFELCLRKSESDCQRSRRRGRRSSRSRAGAGWQAGQKMMKKTAMDRNGQRLKCFIVFNNVQRRRLADCAWQTAPATFPLRCPAQCGKVP